jgi:hypothetical protein
VWPFTGSKFASQHITAAFKGLSLQYSLAAEARQMPLLHLLKSITIRYTKEVLELPPKTVEDVPGAWQCRTQLYRYAGCCFTCYL